MVDLWFFLAFLAQYISSIINVTVFDIEQSSENTALIMDYIDNNIWFIILPILFAPLLEEIIFRKIIFGQLYKKMNFFLAAVISSSLFSVLHLDFTFTLTYIAMGLVFAYLYVKTKRILVPILVHMAMNTTVVLLQLTVDLEDLEKQLQEYQNAAMILIGG
ncbi:CPBP family intramembrane glutamic endopeptidase [Piscibacillus salipiscarius]|uniref:CPBP family intramembrane glutamic endopeptidase n=1 Tax=Piscibacillus salipiscarius TaxID=299480 RepID=UPI0006D0EC41|nr:CPBP family intramembrane glutamic endopeptidase [Piscibacillus salipiscarius]